MTHTKGDRKAFSEVGTGFLRCYDTLTSPPMGYAGEILRLNAL
jgi:hypothetical protein